MKVVKKLLSSFAKRKNILLGNGFSVEKVYDCKWLIDWSNTVDKKMAYKLFEDEQINYFINNTNKKVSVLVATSGDTGGAVAAGFNGFPSK